MRSARAGEDIDRERAVGPDTPMRELVSLARERGGPFPVLGDDGALLGIVGEDEIYDGLLRRRSRSPQRAGSGQALSTCGYIYLVGRVSISQR